MVNFVGRWIISIAHVIFALIIRPLLVGALIVGSAATCIAIVIAAFWYLQPAWALAAMFLLALGLAALFLVIIKDASPPTHWP
ncbi:MAG: hypothetical protein WCB02_23575 [Bradyrhizobium sp.]